MPFRDLGAVAGMRTPSHRSAGLGASSRLLHFFGPLEPRDPPRLADQRDSAWSASFRSRVWFRHGKRPLGWLPVLLTSGRTLPIGGGCHAKPLGGQMKMAPQHFALTAAVTMTGSPARSAASCSPTAKVDASGADLLPDLPPGITPYRAAFKNWSGEIVVDSLWSCSVDTAEDVVLLANWARINGYRLRPRGYAHNWSPLTIPAEDRTR